MSPADQVEDVAYFVLHVPGGSRRAAAHEVCATLEPAKSVIFRPQAPHGGRVEAWYLASPDLAHIDGNGRQVSEEVLATADLLGVPGCHSVVVGFDTLVPRGVSPALVATRALRSAADVRRYVPTEVKNLAAAGEQHLTEAVIARAARLSSQERSALREAVDPAALLHFATLDDLDRGPDARLAPPAAAGNFNRSWNRAVAATGHTRDELLGHAVGGAAGALCVRALRDTWQGWEGGDRRAWTTGAYLELTRPWRETIGPLHEGDEALIHGATPGITGPAAPRLSGPGVL